ncbi:GNAT family N-acetyltransferase [Sulfitobacter sp. HNIBRBA3233]|uniref:GNAT family N-acetyltransferase n=1 Tax=Sulfitobacter marinivivus TaxID=3158558 RepID=UPI0032DEB426
MTPADMAALHAAAFDGADAWSESSIAETLAQPHVVAFATSGGFALTRTVAGESELLTLATAPACRRRGIARGLLGDWLASLEGSADTAFLEVAEDNPAAIALYTSLGFSRSGLRRRYYTRPDGQNADALLMSRAVTLGQTCLRPPFTPESG